MKRYASAPRESGVGRRAFRRMKDITQFLKIKSTSWRSSHTLSECCVGRSVAGAADRLTILPCLLHFAIYLYKGEKARIAYQHNKLGETVFAGPPQHPSIERTTETTAAFGAITGEVSSCDGIPCAHGFACDCFSSRAKCRQKCSIVYPRIHRPFPEPTSPWFRWCWWPPSSSYPCSWSTFLPSY